MLGLTKTGQGVRVGSRGAVGVSAPYLGSLLIRLCVALYFKSDAVGSIHAHLAAP